MADLTKAIALIDSGLDVPDQIASRHRIYRARDILVQASESVSQQITRLLGTDDWTILHSGHQLIIDVELDALEAGAG